MNDKAELNVDNINYENVMGQMLRRMEAIDREVVMEETTLPDVPRISDEAGQLFSKCMLNSALRYLLMELMGAQQIFDQHPEFHPLDPTISLLQQSSVPFHASQRKAALEYLQQAREAEHRPDCTTVLLRLARAGEVETITETDIALQMLDALMKLTSTFAEGTSCSSHPDS